MPRKRLTLEEALKALRGTRAWASHHGKFLPRRHAMRDFMATALRRRRATVYALRHGLPLPRLT